MMLHIFKCASRYKWIFNRKILYNLHNCLIVKIWRIYSTICGSLNMCAYKPCLHFDITVVMTITFLLKITYTHTHTRVCYL